MASSSAQVIDLASYRKNRQEESNRPDGATVNLPLVPVYFVPVYFMPVVMVPGFR